MKLSPQIQDDRRWVESQRDHADRRAAFGLGAWEDLPGPIGSTNALVLFTDATATNAQNFYRVRVGP